VGAAGAESGAQDESGRVEGRHKRGLDCQTRFRLSLFSLHARGDDEGADANDGDGGGEGEAEDEGEDEGKGKGEVE
jgi:hypothetical protein